MFGTSFHTGISDMTSAFGYRISFWLTFRFQHTALQTVVRCSFFVQMTVTIPTTLPTWRQQLLTHNFQPLLPRYRLRQWLLTHASQQRLLTHTLQRRLPTDKFQDTNFDTYFLNLINTVLFVFLVFYFCGDFFHFFASYFFKVFYLFWFSFGLVRSV